MPVAVPTPGPRSRPSMPELSAWAELVKRRRRDIKARIATGRKARSRRELAAVIRDCDSDFVLSTWLVWKLLCPRRLTRSPLVPLANWQHPMPGLG